MHHTQCGHNLSPTYFLCKFFIINDHDGLLKHTYKCMYLQPDDGVNSETLLQFIIKMF